MTEEEYEEEFHKHLDIGLLPPDIKLVVMVTRAGWSTSEALKLLDAGIGIPNKESLQNLHAMVVDLQKEVEELFWRTHPSGWKENCL